MHNSKLISQKQTEKVGKEGKQEDITVSGDHQATTRHNLWNEAILKETNRSYIRFTGYNISLWSWPRTIFRSAGGKEHFLNRECIWVGETCSEAMETSRKLR